jgi:hypothetical protein
MKDIHSILDIEDLIGAAVLKADNVPAAVDLLGFNAAEIAIGVGVGGITFTAANKIEFELTHSEDGSVYDAVTDDDVLGVSGITSGIVKSLTAEHATADVSRLGYIGGRRYIKLLAHFSGAHDTGTPIAALVVKGYPERATA